MYFFLFRRNCLPIVLIFPCLNVLTVILQTIA